MVIGRGRGRGRGRGYQAWSARCAQRRNSSGRQGRIGCSTHRNRLGRHSRLNRRVQKIRRAAATQMTTGNRRGWRIEMLLLLQTGPFRRWTQTEVGRLSHVQRRAGPDCHVWNHIGGNTIDCLRGVLLNRGLPGTVETEEKMKPKRKPAMLPYLTIQGEREFCGAGYGNIGNPHTVFLSWFLLQK